MRLAQNPTGMWVVLYNDQPIAISGQTQFDSREDAVEQIATRGLTVKADGEIFRPVEPVQFQAPEPVEAPPETAPAPVQTIAIHTIHTTVEGMEDAQHFYFDPNASVPNDQIMGIEIEEPAPVSAEDLGLKEDFTLPEFEEAVAKAEPEKIPEAPKGKRGRPRTYSPEEAAERRREQNRRYYHARKEARREEVAGRSKEWWETHPEKVQEYREKANEKRRSRYQSDPEYRAKVSAYNREYQAKKRAERMAQKPEPEA